MNYIRIKRKILEFEREVDNKVYHSKKFNHIEKLTLIDQLTNAWSNLFLDLYDYRGKLPLDNGKDKLYIKLNNIRDNIMTINLKRR